MTRTHITEQELERGYQKFYTGLIKEMGIAGVFALAPYELTVRSMILNFDESIFSALPEDMAVEDIIEFTTAVIATKTLLMTGDDIPDTEFTRVVIDADRQLRGQRGIDLLKYNT